MFCEKVTNFLSEHGDSPIKDYHPDEDESTQKKEEIVVDDDTESPTNVVAIDDDEEDESHSIKRPPRKDKASEIIKKGLDKSTTSEEELTPKKRVKTDGQLDDSTASQSAKTNGLSPEKDEVKGTSLKCAPSNPR